jgi:hypothetical protein
VSQPLASKGLSLVAVPSPTAETKPTVAKRSSDLPTPKFEPKPAIESKSEPLPVASPLAAGRNVAIKAEDSPPSPLVTEQPNVRLAIPSPNPEPAVVLNSAASNPSPTAKPVEPAPSATYRLPNQVTLHYEANRSGFQGKSTLSWKKSIDAAAQSTRYEAQLASSATVLFKTFEHRFKSTGVINDWGLAPLRVEEKRTNGSTVATTIEPANNRVIISSKEGFLPYDPLAHDLVSLMVQLAILAQTQPSWQQAGTAQDFTVYRPSGIKRWRFQSMGITTITLGARQHQTVYVRRVTPSGEIDYEDQYHFWLDLNRYGFPVKMRLVDSKNNATDITMIDWQEL